MARGEDSKLQERLLDSFRYLCNTDGPNNQLSMQEVEEVRSMIKQIPTPLNVNSDPTPATTSLPKFTDRLKQRLRREESNEQLSQTEQEPASPTSGSGGESDTESVASSASRVSGASKASRSSKVSGKSEQSERSRSDQSKRKRKPETYEQHKMKKNFLCILRTLQKEGYQPTQDYTMDDSLQDIKEEVDQYYMCKEASSFVSKWKNNVEVGASMIEVGVQFIPKQPLKMQGLQSRIRKVHESKQVDIDWERIYYTYRRKKMSNPLWSLAMTYGFAMLSTQITNYASSKFNSVMGGNGGGGDGNGSGGGGGIDLGGIIQSLFGAFGSQAGGPKPSDMPSMTTGLPGSNSSEPPRQTPSAFMPQQGASTPAPAPKRGFKRSVFF